MKMLLNTEDVNGLRHITKTAKMGFSLQDLSAGTFGGTLIYGMNLALLFIYFALWVFLSKASEGFSSNRF